MEVSNIDLRFYVFMQQVDSQWRRKISKVECDEFFTRTRMMYTVYEIGILNVYVTMPAH